MIKRIILSLSCFFIPFCALAQMKWNSLYQTYIDQYKDLAVEQMMRYNIPASITLAQGLFESGAGRSQLAIRSNNHFGIKCHDWRGKKTFHDDDEEQECFRVYANVNESYEDHSLFLVNNSRYNSLFSLKINDYKGWAKGLKLAGYATNPAYANKLIEVIELYRLYEYDRMYAFGHTYSKGRTVSSGMGMSGNTHTIRMNNRNYYVQARPGDTFSSLAKEFDVSARKLAKYNERSKKDVLQDGEIVYLMKKRTKADKAFKKKPHTVRPGESMYSIAQQYGIKLKSLYKKNDLNPETYRLRVGDKLKVY